jgi:hypothetical protein
MESHGRKVKVFAAAVVAVLATLGIAKIVKLSNSQTTGEYSKNGTDGDTDADDNIQFTVENDALQKNEEEKHGKM